MNLLLALLLSIHAMFSPAPPENVADGRRLPRPHAAL